MKNQTAAAIVAAADEIGTEVKHYEGYSGRGMYGKKTDGVTGSLTDIIAAIALASVRVKEEEDNEAKPAISHDDFMEDLSKLATDSMGRSDIILY